VERPENFTANGMAACGPFEPDSATLRRLAARIRLRATEMVAIQGFGYLGQAFSSAEIFAVLFGDAMRYGHDRFVLSPGHYVIALYAAAAETGLLDPQALATYGKDGSPLEAIGSERTPLGDLVCGSLGQGLSGAVGFARPSLPARIAIYSRFLATVKWKRAKSGRRRCSPPIDVWAA
jgi:transketolase N-terminal domain/subunit